MRSDTHHGPEVEVETLVPCTVCKAPGIFWPSTDRPCVCYECERESPMRADLAALTARVAKLEAQAAGDLAVKPVSWKEMYDDAERRVAYWHRKYDAVRDREDALRTQLADSDALRTAMIERHKEELAKVERARLHYAKYHAKEKLVMAVVEAARVAVSPVTWDWQGPTRLRDLVRAIEALDAAGETRRTE